MRLRERGSSSVLFLGLIVPVMSLFLVVGIELQQFFGMREEIQRIIDEEARLDVARAWRESEVPKRLQREFLSLSPYVDITEVKHLRENGKTAIGVSGSFTGVFTQAVAAFSDGGTLGISFSVRTEARRPRASVVVAIDRRIEDGDAECGNARIEKRELIAARLLEGLIASESVDVQYGTFPAGEDGFLVLGAGIDEQDVRCSGTGEPDPLGAQGLRGLTGAGAWGLDGVFGTVRAFQEQKGSAEISAIIAVAPNDQAGVKTIFETAALLASESSNSIQKTKVLGLLVGDSGDGVSEIWRGELSNVGIRIVPVSAEGSVDPAVVSGPVHDLTSHIVVAR